MSEHNTAGEYGDESETILMGDDKYPRYGYRPIDIRKRIKHLLFQEEQAALLQKALEETAVLLPKAYNAALDAVLEGARELPATGDVNSFDGMARSAARGRRTGRQDILTIAEGLKK